MARETSSKYRRFLSWATRSEKGNVGATFALTCVAVVVFVGLALDVGMVLWEHNKTDGLCQVVSENRHVHQDMVRYSNDPAQATVQYVSETLAANGYRGEAVVTFEEGPRHENQRHIEVTVTLSHQSPFYFLRIFGLDGVTTVSRVEFEDDYGEAGDDVVWAPSSPVGAYNGSYSVVFG